MADPRIIPNDSVQAAAPIVRAAVAGDTATLADLGRRSFVTAFGHLYRAHDLATFLDHAHAHPVVAAQIADPAMRVMVAVGADGVLLGFCKLVMRCGWPDHARGVRTVELKQLYADPARIGQRIGAALIERAFAEARRFGADEMQLSVWSENAGAQRFYARHGFAKVADIEFWVGTHCDAEFLYARPLA